MRQDALWQRLANFIVLMVALAILLCNFARAVRERLDELWLHIDLQQQEIAAIEEDMTDLQAAISSLNVTTTTKATKPVCIYSEADLDLATRVVIVEARGASFKGQAAVAQVILDRMKCKKADWGGPTVKGVLCRPKQFSAPERGDISNYQQAKSAVKAVFLDGYRVFEGCALVFFNPAKSGAGNVSWARRNYKLLGKIDGHEFRGV